MEQKVELKNAKPINKCKELEILVLGVISKD